MARRKSKRSLRRRGLLRAPENYPQLGGDASPELILAHRELQAIRNPADPTRLRKLEEARERVRREETRRR
jgi:hypothetical protein